MPRLKRMKLAELAQHGFYLWQQDRPDVVALDTETEGVAFYDRPFCVTATWRSKILGGELFDAYFELGDESGTRDAMVRQILGNTSTWIFHNAKFDLQKFLLVELCDRKRLDEVCIHDTEAIFHLMHNVDRKGLKYLAGKHLGGEGRRVPEKRLAKVRRSMGLKKDDGYMYLPREYVVPYAMSDTRLTYELYEYGYQRLPTSMEPLYRAEQRLCLTLLDMEMRGMALDLDYLKKQQSEYGQKVVDLLGQIRAEAGIEELNPGSVPQLKKAFAARGFELESTDVDHLQALDDRLAALILEYREATKMHKTYLTGLMQEQRDGIVHPNFRQHGARTGRMSSGSASAD